MAKKSKLICDNNEWTFENLKVVEKEIAIIAKDELRLDPYPAQIEIISADQMLELYSSHGMPVMYNHWSFGRRFMIDQKSYQKGHSGLAYEIVINTDPAIAYCMENNSFTMQALVIAHASYGHSHFFKNNYLFKQQANAESIIDYLLFAKSYIAKCESQHGTSAVESILDACHALSDYGVDRYKRPPKLSKAKEKLQQQRRVEMVQQSVNELWRTLPATKTVDEEKDEYKFPTEPQENILYFLEKNSPVLADWQRELLRIVRKIAQYFMPQRQTKVGNEGWASFVHYYVMNRLWEKGKISNGNFLEFIHSHSGVLYQPTYDSKHYSGFNPYALGFDIFTDIRRICENPTAEDREYFPTIVDTDWIETCLDAVANYRDESFIAQFLSPHIMRKWRMFEISNQQSNNFVEVSNIQNEKGYNSIRRALSQQYSISYSHPDIQIVDADIRGNRTLSLRYNSVANNRLAASSEKVVEYIKQLWGYPVQLDTYINK